MTDLTTLTIAQARDGLKRKSFSATELADAHIAAVERARAGDGQAFGALYERYADRVYSFVLFRVRDESVAEDLTQDVFIQVLRGLAGYAWQGTLAPWVLRIGRIYLSPRADGKPG